jgi:hypothetical protein
MISLLLDVLILAVSRTKCNRVEVTVPVFHEVEVGEEV